MLKPLCSQTLISLAICTLFTGCALQNTASPIAGPGVQLRGVVHGGQPPVIAAHVHLMVASTAGYGAASTSLLTLNTAGTDAFGGYVTTDNLGSFTITGDYVCTPGTQAYILATGGNPGLPSGQTNDSLALMTAIGQCPADGNFLLSVPNIYVNEVTTVGSIYAIAGYMTDLSHVASSGTALANQGLANAFTNATNLFDVNTGQALAATPLGNGTAPQAEINSLANIIAPCINSVGASSTACSTLFANALNGATPPSDTVTALLNIAHNPAQNVANLFGLQTAGSPFMPDLGQAPNDFTIALAFTGGGINSPVSISIDGSGNVWMANSNNSVSQINGATGAPISPAAGYTGNGLNYSYSIANDTAGNAWLVNYTSVSEFTPTGAPAPNSPFTGGGLDNPPNYGVLSPRNIAFDANGNAWIANYQAGGSLTELNGLTGVAMSPAGGFPIAGTNTQPNGVAIDSAGHVWSSGYNVPQIYETNVATGATIFTSARNAGGLDVGISIAIDSANNLWLPDNYDPNTLVGVTLTELTSAGIGATSSPYSGGRLLDPDGIAMDGAGNAWISNNVAPDHVNFYVTEFSNTGALLSPSGFTSTTLQIPSDIAVDGSGNVWVTSAGVPAPNYSTTPGLAVVELVGAAVPVITPIAAGVAQSTMAVSRIALASVIEDEGQSDWSKRSYCKGGIGLS